MRRPLRAARALAALLPATAGAQAANVIMGDDIGWYKTSIYTPSPRPCRTACELNLDEVMRRLAPTN